MRCPPWLSLSEICFTQRYFIDFLAQSAAFPSKASPTSTACYSLLFHLTTATFTNRKCNFPVLWWKTFTPLVSVPVNTGELPSQRWNESHWCVWFQRRLEALPGHSHPPIDLQQPGLLLLVVHLAVHGHDELLHAAQRLRHAGVVLVRVCCVGERRGGYRPLRCVSLAPASVWAHTTQRPDLAVVHNRIYLCLIW